MDLHHLSRRVSGMMLRLTIQWVDGSFKTISINKQDRKQSIEYEDRTISANQCSEGR